MYSNIRGLKGKKLSLTSILHENEPHIFLLTETQLRSNTGIAIEGYTFYGRKREGGTGGGVGILIRNDIRQNVAPHTSERNIELMWISIRRKNLPPVIMGSYYGKQETRTNRDEIEREMRLLKEEITEMQNEGEILLAMDGNAKIGILGEDISRNGRLLLQLMDDTGLHIMNKSEKCFGKITRRNTKKEEEKSAIDFIVTNSKVEKWIKKITIDEEGLLRIKGRNETDHNTITIDMIIKNIEKSKREKKTGWNIRAPAEKWANFSHQLCMLPVCLKNG